MNSALLKTSEAAALIGCSPALLRLSRHTGELWKGVPAPPYVKFSKDLNRGAVRYKRTSIEKWLEEFCSEERQHT